MADRSSGETAAAASPEITIGNESEEEEANTETVTLESSPTDVNNASLHATESENALTENSPIAATSADEKEAENANAHRATDVSQPDTTAASETVVREDTPVATSSAVIKLDVLNNTEVTEGTENVSRPDASKSGEDLAVDSTCAEEKEAASVSDLRKTWKEKEQTTKRSQLLNLNDFHMQQRQERVGDKLRKGEAAKNLHSFRNNDTPITKQKSDGTVPIKQPPPEQTKAADRAAMAQYLFLRQSKEKESKPAGANAPHRTLSLKTATVDLTPSKSGDDSSSSSKSTKSSTVWRKSPTSGKNVIVTDVDEFYAQQHAIHLENERKKREILHISDNKDVLPDKSSTLPSPDYKKTVIPSLVDSVSEEDSLGMAASSLSMDEPEAKAEFTEALPRNLANEYGDEPSKSNISEADVGADSEPPAVVSSGLDDVVDESDASGEVQTTDKRVELETTDQTKMSDENVSPKGGFEPLNKTEDDSVAEIQVKKEKEEAKPDREAADETAQIKKKTLVALPNKEDGAALSPQDHVDDEKITADATGTRAQEETSEDSTLKPNSIPSDSQVDNADNTTAEVAVNGAGTSEAEEESTQDVDRSSRTGTPEAHVASERSAVKVQDETTDASKSETEDNGSLVDVHEGEDLVIAQVSGSATDETKNQQAEGYSAEVDENINVDEDAVAETGTSIEGAHMQAESGTDSHSQETTDISPMNSVEPATGAVDGTAPAIGAGTQDESVRGNLLMTGDEPTNKQSGDESPVAEEGKDGDEESMPAPTESENETQPSQQPEGRGENKGTAEPTLMADGNDDGRSDRESSVQKSLSTVAEKPTETTERKDGDEERVPPPMDIENEAQPSPELAMTGTDKPILLPDGKNDGNFDEEPPTEKLKEDQHDGNEVSACIGEDGDFILVEAEDAVAETGREDAEDVVVEKEESFVKNEVESSGEQSDEDGEIAFPSAEADVAVARDDEVISVENAKGSEKERQTAVSLTREMETVEDDSVVVQCKEDAVSEVICGESSGGEGVIFPESRTAETTVVAVSSDSPVAVGNVSDEAAVQADTSTDLLKELACDCLDQDSAEQSDGTRRIAVPIANETESPVVPKEETVVIASTEQPTSNLVDHVPDDIANASSSDSDSTASVDGDAKDEQEDDRIMEKLEEKEQELVDTRMEETKTTTKSPGKPASDLLDHVPDDISNASSSDSDSTASVGGDAKDEQEDDRIMEKLEEKEQELVDARMEVTKTTTKSPEKAAGEPLDHVPDDISNVSSSESDSTASVDGDDTDDLADEGTLDEVEEKEQESVANQDAETNVTMASSGKPAGELIDHVPDDISNVSSSDSDSTASVDGDLTENIAHDAENAEVVSDILQREEEPWDEGDELIPSSNLSRSIDNETAEGDAGMTVSFTAEEMNDIETSANDDTAEQVGTNSVSPAKDADETSKTVGVVQETIVAYAPLKQVDNNEAALDYGIAAASREEMSAESVAAESLEIGADVPKEGIADCDVEIEAVQADEVVDELLSTIGGTEGQPLSSDVEDRVDDKAVKATGVEIGSEEELGPHDESVLDELLASLDDTKGEPTTEVDNDEDPSETAGTDPEEKISSQVSEADNNAGKAGTGDGILATEVPSDEASLSAEGEDGIATSLMNRIIADDSVLNVFEETDADTSGFGSEYNKVEDRSLQADDHSELHPTSSKDAGDVSPSEVIAQFIKSGTSGDAGDIVAAEGSKARSSASSATGTDSSDEPSHDPLSCAPSAGSTDKPAATNPGAKVEVDYKNADYRGFIFVVHKSYGLVLLYCTRKKKKGPHYQLPGGHIDEPEFFAAAEESRDGQSQLLLAARAGAARELYEETGMDVRFQLDRMEPAALRNEVELDKQGKPILKNELKRRLYFFLAVTDDDFWSSDKGDSDAGKMHPLGAAKGCEGSQLMLKLSHEHQGWTFEKDPNKSAEMLAVHSGGQGAIALRMSMARDQAMGVDSQEPSDEKPAALERTTKELQSETWETEPLVKDETTGTDSQVARAAPDLLPPSEASGLAKLFSCCLWFQSSDDD